MGRIIGIDLGTTTSEVAHIKNGKPEIITNKEGERITPSVLSIKNGELLIGTSAKTNYVIKPEDSIIEVKRLMGTNEKVKMAGKEYLPEEASALILKYLKEFAEEALDEEVTEAVITVPANFNDLQRNATKKAGELAGLKVERIINEPTAAAMAYGLDHMEDDSKILVYDLGGGTFDVTVLELFTGILDVKASRGNNSLGGKDFDERLINYILSIGKKEYDTDLSKNVNVLSRIKDAAEKCKKELSFAQSSSVNLMYLAQDKDGQPINLELDITRQEFQDMIKDLVSSTIDTVNETLRAANYTADDIDIVLLVGGSTRVPLVKDVLKGIFGDKVKSTVSPDEVVALGAAIQAGIKNEEIKSEDGLIVADTCNYTMGISVLRILDNNEAIDGVFDPILTRDTKIPCAEKKIYYTVNNGQTEMNIRVYQGENEFVRDNTQIGEFELTGIPDDLAGAQSVEVEFKYNLNGILEVTAVVQSNGNRVQGVIDTSKAFGENRPSATEENASNDSVDNWTSYPLAVVVEDTIILAEKRKEKLNGKFAVKIDDLVKKLKQAVIDGNKDLVNKLDDEITDLLFDL